MNCRERVLRTIRFEQPDRIPFTYTVTPTALFRHGQRLLDFCRQHPNDFYDPGIIQLPQRDAAHYRPDGSYYKEEVYEVFGSPSGGFIYGLALEDLPFENVAAAFRAVEEFREL